MGSLVAMAVSRASRVNLSIDALSSWAVAWSFGAGVCQGQSVPELPEFGLLGLGDDAIGHGVGNAPFSALLEGLVDGGGGAVPVGVSRDVREGEPE